MRSGRGSNEVLPESAFLTHLSRKSAVFRPTNAYRSLSSLQRTSGEPPFLRIAKKMD